MRVERKEREREGGEEREGGREKGEREVRIDRQKRERE